MQSGKCCFANESTMSAVIPSPVVSAEATQSDGIPAMNPCAKLSSIGFKRVSSSTRGIALDVTC